MKVRTRATATDGKRKRTLKTLAKICKIAGYVCSLLVAGYGFYWLTIPGGGVIGGILIVLSVFIAIETHRTIKIER